MITVSKKPAEVWVDHEGRGVWVVVSESDSGPYWQCLMIDIKPSLKPGAIFRKHPNGKNQNFLKGMGGGGGPGRPLVCSNGSCRLATVNELAKLQPLWKGSASEFIY